MIENSMFLRSTVQVSMAMASCDREIVAVL